MADKRIGKIFHNKIFMPTTVCICIYLSLNKLEGILSNVSALTIIALLLCYNQLYDFAI